MLNSFPVSLLVALILGLLSGLGIGGGSLLILWLTLVTGMDPVQARILNLLFFIPCALVSSLFRWKQGSLKLPYVLAACIPGCICAGVISWFFGGIHTPLIRKFFGVLLLLTGIREIFYRERKPK